MGNVSTGSVCFILSVRVLISCLIPLSVDSVTHATNSLSPPLPFFFSLLHSTPYSDGKPDPKEYQHDMSVRTFLLFYGCLL